MLTCASSHTHDDIKCNGARYMITKVCQESLAIKISLCYRVGKLLKKELQLSDTKVFESL